MKIQFQFDIEDWMQFQLDYLNNSKQFRNIKIISTLTIPVIFSFFILLDAANHRFRPGLVIFYTCVAILWVIFYPKWMMSRTMTRTKKILMEGNNSGLLGLHELEFNEEGITLKQPDSEYKAAWKGIKKIQENENYFFLYNTSVSAIIIPKRKIESDLKEVDRIIKTHLHLTSAGNP